MDYHKTTIALIAWLVWGGDKKTVAALYESEIRSTTFRKPDGTKTYQVRVTK